MDRAYLPGPMVVDMKENTYKIRNMVLVFTHGPIIGSTLASGKMVNSMVKEFTRMLIKLNVQVFGSMARELLGSTTKISKNKWKI